MVRVKKPLLIGLMLSKDDGDIIEQVMTEYNRYFDTIFCIDASVDNSLKIIKSFSKVEYAVSEKELGVDGSLLKDGGLRQLLLSRIQDAYGYDGWIFAIHSDEIFWGDPASLVNRAIDENTNILNGIIAHFVLHPDNETAKDKPHIADRLLWYFMGQCENIGFKNQKGLYYNFCEHMRTIPHGFYPQVTCSNVIVRRHYNIRSSEQGRDRIKDRLARNWQPAYVSYPANLYIKDPNQIITAGAIYSEIQKFDGEFRFSPEYEYWQKRIVR
ncbi:MAG: hypothetical protein QME51_01930 [Planctomycetota bacterium]|nr:hypothetical protein [Planctomycetota bacterium]